MGLDLKRDIASDEAVAHWYDTVFTPVAEVIREQGVLSEFPGRTQADLYLWILRHRAEVEEELGWEIGTEVAAANFAAHHSPGAGRVAARVGEKILDAIVPADFDARPPAVEWRKQVAARHEDAVFADILVAVDADPTRWHGLEQSLQIARAEGARVHGLYVVSSAAAAASEQTAALQVAFDRRCQETGVAGRLAVEVGNLVDTISARAQWVDLIVLDHAPTTKANATTFDRRWRSIVRRCPSHLLFVPGPAQPMKRAMLVYDGGPTAREALRVAGHMGSQHKLSLSLFATSEGDAHRMKQMLATAQDYLRERGIDVAVIKADGPIAEAILDAAEQEKIDLIITGSYSQHPWFAPGNYVAELLRLTSRPVLMCR
jgi:nucleotide-binding universal stress UspA family protein